MKRVKRHKIKAEKPEASHSRESEEHDLAYYIHDRVELMHQVFSVLKYKDLKAMAPECVRNLPIGDLQELCTEELLGISSKRLLATLDGCDPPSDTESSSASPSPEQLETISLDSISSDEEILSQSSKKKKHKHRRNSKTKSKKKEKGKGKSKDSTAADENTEVSKASRAGLTVLELLELQARARAIRAQLQNEQAKKQLEAAATAVVTDDDDEVEIKEEAPDVVEISSGDEKPDINVLRAAVQKSPKAKEVAKPKETQKEKVNEPKSKETTQMKDTPKPAEKPAEPPKDTQKQEDDKDNAEKAVTKRVNDLIITVPQAKATRKIKLNRSKVTTVPNVPESIPADSCIAVEKPAAETPKDPSSDKKKKKKAKKKKNLEKEGSDGDEITLQLSDTEKMDLLEDLHEINYQRVSSGTSDSSDSSSDSEVNASKEAIEETDLNKDDAREKLESLELAKITEKKELSDQEANNTTEEKVIVMDESVKNTNNYDIDNIDLSSTKEIEKECTSNGDIIKESPTEVFTENIDKPEGEGLITNDNREPTLQANKDFKINEVEEAQKMQTEEIENRIEVEHVVEPTNEVETEKLETLPLDVEKENQIAKCTETESTTEKEEEHEKIVEAIEIATIDDIPLRNDNAQEGNAHVKEREISEGELTDRESSEVEAYDVEPEVVCISDDEKQKKKKKKKEKKAKKEKKSKKSKQDFRESADQNFYKDAKTLSNKSCEIDDVDQIDGNGKAIDLTDDDVYEILELSDASSCYEVEGTVLSKEPTAEEISALSARIDEIKREDIEQTNESTPTTEDNSSHTKSDESDDEIEQISWKDRYLDSKKVKRVLTTANILNALRKKNKELKKKMEDVKKKDMEVQEEKVLEEGSIGHYETLQGSSKYVNPIPESTDEITEEVSKEGKGEKNEEALTREMKKDAKQLLKMFRKLMNNKKVKRREKKKKRKMKKKEETAPETVDNNIV